MAPSQAYVGKTLRSVLAHEKDYRAFAKTFRLVAKDRIPRVVKGTIKMGSRIGTRTVRVMPLDKDTVVAVVHAKDVVADRRH